MTITGRQVITTSAKSARAFDNPPTTCGRLGTGGKDMTRKDYQGIAEVLRVSLDDCQDSESVMVWARVCHRMASMLESDNDRFVRRKFLMACGFEVAGLYVDQQVFA
jgi:hypothetical protein